MLGGLPTHDYVHLIFDHASPEALKRLWARTTGLMAKPPSFS
jgi:hypothetical protein